jgi:hypothetical protein
MSLPRLPVTTTRSPPSKGLAREPVGPYSHVGPTGSPVSEGDAMKFFVVLLYIILWLFIGIPLLLTMIFLSLILLILVFGAFV